jgi:hypothetical protein
MMIFNPHTIRSAAFLLGLAGAGLADDLALEDGGKLSGKVTALTADGHLMVTSPLSRQPIDLRADKVNRIVFGTGAKLTDEHDSLVALTNGDQFPCDLQSIDATQIKVDTGFAGALVIPRTAVRMLQLGVRPRKVIYDGPQNADGWDVKAGWKAVTGSFVTESNGLITRKFDLPENHSLHFDLSWGNVPNLQVGIDDDDPDPGSRSDRYVLNINGAGLDLKREQKEGNRRYLPMANIPRDLIGSSDQTVSVELRIDRKLAVVSLYLDGKNEGRWADPSGHSPKGSSIFFRGSVAGEDTLTLEGIRLSEWDASADRHRSEERGDTSKDSIILRDGDRGMGEILSYRADAKDGVLRYKMPHLAEPLETSSAEISTLFFAETPHDSAVKPLLTLTLQGRGSLSLGEASFDGNAIHCNHPLLGPLTIHSEAAVKLDRVRPPAKTPEPDDSDDGDDTGDQ